MINSIWEDDILPNTICGISWQTILQKKLFLNNVNDILNLVKIYSRDKRSQEDPEGVGNTVEDEVTGKGGSHDDPAPASVGRSRSQHLRHLVLVDVLQLGSENHIIIWYFDIYLQIYSHEWVHFLLYSASVSSLIMMMRYLPTD